MVTALVLLLAGKVVWLAALGVGAYFGLRYVRLQERRAKDTEIADLRTQVRQLQETVDRLELNLGRVQEGQDFTARLLSERVKRE